MNKFSLKNKTALITGSSRGLGKAIALAFAGAGADVVLVSRSKSALENVKKEIEQMGRKAWIFPFDLSMLSISTLSRTFVLHATRCHNR